MSNLISAITLNCGEHNLPGVKSLLILPTDWLDDGEYEEITLNGNFQRAINPTLGGQQWIALPFFPANGDGWQQSHRKTDNGNEYTQEISGIIPKLAAVREFEFDRMVRHRFLARLTDKNNRQWLVGRLEEPLELVVSGETAASSGGRNGYAFRLSGTTTKRAFSYVPVF